MSNWNTCQLSELVAVHHGFAFPSAECRSPQGTAPRLIRIGDFARTARSDFQPQRVQEYLGAFPQKFRLDAGDLLMAMTCQSSDGEILGVTMRVPDDGVTYLHNQRIGKIEIHRPDLLDSQFLEYAVRDSSFNHHLFVTASGSKILHTAPKRILGYTFALPPLHVQRRIAGVLGALDDLIETNQRLAEGLQHLALVHYEDLISEIDETALLGDLVLVNPWQTRAKDDGELTYLDIASIGDGVIDWPARMPWSEAPSRARRLVREGCTIWSTVRPNRRAHALMTHVPEDLVVSTGFAVLAPNIIGPAETYCATDGAAFVDYLMSRAEGSAYPAVRGSVFKDALLPFLGVERSRAMEATAWPLLHAAGELQRETRELATARDELLPLLLSGKVSVHEVAA